MGTPTVTVVLAGREHMLPWASFVDADLEGGRIRVRFTGWELTLQGRDLRELWREIQLQDVRVLRTAALVEAGDCRLDRIDLQPLETSG